MSFLQLRYSLALQYYFFVIFLQATIFMNVLYTTFIGQRKYRIESATNITTYVRIY